MSWAGYYWDVLVTGDRAKAAAEYAALTNAGAGDVVAGPADTQPLLTPQDAQQVAPPGSTFKPYGQNLLDWWAANSGTVELVAVALAVVVGGLLILYVIGISGPVIQGLRVLLGKG